MCVFCALLCVKFGKSEFIYPKTRMKNIKRWSDKVTRFSNAINRAGENLDSKQKQVLEQAKSELRKVFRIG